VLVYHPHTQQTHVVASGFFYSDGVVVSDDGSYLLVVETDALRVMKVWLAGGKVSMRYSTATSDWCMCSICADFCMPCWQT
jgi:sugar lactone lactonase YvrE